MQKKSDNGNNLYKAGLFVILCMSLLIFSIFWLRFFSLTTEKTITAKFAECGPISKGIPVFYHGVNIGKVKDVTFSRDFIYTLVEISIYKKHLDLPKNVYTEIKIEGLTGQKYMDIVYPKNPSGKILADKDVIEGRLSDMQLVQKALSNALKNGQAAGFAEKFNNVTANASEASKKIIILTEQLQDVVNSNKNDVRKIVRETTFSASNIRSSSDSIKNLSGDAELHQGIRSTINNMSKSSQKMDSITTNIRKITVDADKITGNPKFLQSTVKAVDEIGTFTERLNKGDLNCLMTKTLQDSDRVINRYDCIGESFSQMMGEKFLLTRLMFGKPGQSFKKCTNLKCIEEELQPQCPCPASPAYTCPGK